MEFQVIIVLALSTLGWCATVGEFPFSTNDSQLEENFTTEETRESAHNLTDSVEQVVNVTTEAPINVLIERKERPQVTPLFKVIRDFLFQARDGLLEPLEDITEAPIEHKTDELIKVIEHGLIEATTVLITQMENTAAPTTPAPIATGQNKMFHKRNNEADPDVKENTSGQLSSTKGKRPTGFDIITNISTSCSTCYNQLQSCVQSCFANHDCNDIQRNVRVCPTTPNRLCNPFTPWSPVDECQSSAECKSPLICCNDGCINKCVSGIWRS